MAEAQSLSDRGYVVEAVELLTKALKGAADPLPILMLRAQFHLQRRNYAGAREDLDAAVAARPKDQSPLFKRAELALMTGRLADAQEDLEAAVKLEPGDEYARIQLLSVAVQRGEAARAEAVAAELAKGSPKARLEARFGLACLDFKLRRGDLGGATFKALADELDPDDGLHHRARFYWAASRTLDPEFARRTGFVPKTKTAKLYLIGLGIFPPYTASLETLHAIGGCDVVFNNVAGPEVRSLIAEFCGDVRPASYQAWQDEPKWADVIFNEVDKGKTVAFVTRGHPLVFGGLAVELIRRCRARKIDHHTFGSVSSIDHLLAFAGKGLGDDFGGITAINFPAFETAAAHNTKLPTLLCFYHGLKDRAAIENAARSLERFYPGALACWMFGPKYDDPPAVVRIDELADKYDSVHPSLMLYVPPLPEGA